MLWKRVSIRAQVVGTTKTFAMWYIRVYQEDFKWIQCPTDTFVGNAAAKDITAFNVVPREGSKGFKECYAWNQPFLMECNRTDTPS